jgi:TRAP-type uncharacterized transport system substrate-binding protein
MRVPITVFLAFSLACTAWSTSAQETGARATTQQRRAAQVALDNYREQVNENVLFLMGGQLSGSYVGLVQDIAIVVDDGLRLRVLPVLGNAAVQNVSDVLFLRGIDLALTTVQTLNHLKQSKQYGANIDRQIVYIAALSNDEMHVLAAPGINTIEDLAGKKVNFHTAGSSTALSGPEVFKALQIDVQVVNMPQGDAIQKMRAGEIAATICICNKPLDWVKDLTAESGFTLLDVPFVDAFRDNYLPALLTRDDYPGLLAKAGKIETVATTTALVSFNWPRGSARYNRTAKFVEAFFSKFADLQRPPRHPMWKSVNLTATVPGWRRFPAAQEWLDRNQPQSASLSASLGKVLSDQGAATTDLPTDSDKLFRDFMEYTRKTNN